MRALLLRAAARYIIRAGSAIHRRTARFEPPLEEHQQPHVGCHHCEIAARYYLRGVTDQMAATDADAAFRRVIRAWEMPVAAGYPEAES